MNCSYFNFRLRCLISICRRLNGSKASHTTFVKTIVPEAVLCVKAVNEKARAAAYDLIAVIGEERRFSLFDCEVTPFFFNFTHPE